MDGVIEQMLSYHNKEKNDSEYAKIQQKKSQNLKKKSLCLLNHNR